MIEFQTLSDEGDAWLERNRADLGKCDHVSSAIEQLGLQPKRLLEVGCSNGWRLKKLREKYICTAYGLDPSEKACAEDVGIIRGQANSIPIFLGHLDLIIFGFCLYLVNPGDMFDIVRDVDCLLDNGGHLIIHDFIPTSTLEIRGNKHNPRMPCYRMNHPGLWLAHPFYKKISEFVDLKRDECVTTLVKRHLTPR